MGNMLKKNFNEFEISLREIFWSLEDKAGNKYIVVEKESKSLAAVVENIKPPK